jgi:Ser/Thr protein kinase RdoA (MazF antagonist)
MAYQPPVRDWWGAESDLDQLEELLAGRGLDAELAYLRDRWSQVLGEWPVERVEALPQGWVLFDYHGRNMIFDGDKMVGLFDVDEIERGPLVFDVARAAHKFGREGRDSLSIRPDAARLFIDAYDAVRTLSAEEREALPVMFAMDYPPVARYYRHARERLGEDIEAWMRREVAAMRALHAQMDAVRSPVT